MPLDFYEDGYDTGGNEEDAIQPYSNGESANENVFNRPLDNLRKRTGLLITQKLWRSLTGLLRFYLTRRQQYCSRKKTPAHLKSIRFR